MSETRFSQGRSSFGANNRWPLAGTARWIDRSPWAMRSLFTRPTTLQLPALCSALTPENPHSARPSKCYNASPNSTPHTPVPTTTPRSTEDSIRDEFWLGPLVVLVAIVWLRLALDAMGILPMNLGY